jgi:hypothetical protein
MVEDNHRPEQPVNLLWAIDEMSKALNEVTAALGQFRERLRRVLAAQNNN